jgi:dTDP-4-amino-4,6-dideoxygalactose transaminase
MDGIQGGILSVKLRYLDLWNNQRRKAAATYDEALANTDVETPVEMAYNRHVYHLYVVQADNRDDLRRRLSEAGIESGLHYPVPLHLQQAYRSLGYTEGAFPVTEKLKDRILSLPMYPGIQADCLERVVSELRENCYVS